jgi:hypothetical protein
VALWKKAFARLRGAPDTSSSPESTDAVETDVLEQDALAVEENLKAAAEMAAGVDLEADEDTFVTTTEAADTRSDVFARELQAGIQVSLGDLERSDAGWRYRGHPVMVFGVESEEITDPARRRQVASLIHLYPCNSALKNTASAAWVATDLKAIESLADSGHYRFCRGCLQAAAGRGADPAKFDFSAHVRSHGDSYFPDGPCYWRPGAEPVSLLAPATKAERACPKCGCNSEEAGWQMSTGDAERLSLPEGICLLCAEREVEGCLHFEGDDLVVAAHARYRSLMAQAARSPVPSWKLAAAILPLGWQPLLQSLERVLPPPELFFSIADSEPPAVLAWPALKRGVVERRMEGVESKGWSLWTRAQIEEELGFTLR